MSPHGTLEPQTLAASQALPGTIDLSLRRKPDGSTGPAQLYQSAPLRLLMPAPPAGEPFQGAVTCVSGGILGGDELDVRVRMETGTEALLIGQAGEKIYRTDGPDSLIRNDLTVGRDGVLEWLPQETILFDGARLRRRTDVKLNTNAQFIGGEMLVFGRVGSGESFTSGLLCDDWRVFDDQGRLIWRDCLKLDADITRRIAHRAGFDHARASALIVCRLKHFSLEPVRTILANNESCKNCLAAAGLVGNIQLVRLISRDVAELRAAFGEIWCLLRATALNRSDRMPTLWRI